MPTPRVSSLALLLLACFSASSSGSHSYNDRPRGPPITLESILAAAAVPAEGPCDDLPGIWTGFVGSRALNDSYSLQWRDAAYPPGSFSALYNMEPPSWVFGAGTLSAGNSTAVLVLDGGRVTLTGNVSDGCSTIVWDNGSSWRKATAMAKTVHLLSIAHLDVGYNGIPVVGWINNVLKVYFEEHLPRAVAMSQALRNRGGPETLITTTHAWLLDMYLHCPANFTLSGVPLACPSAADVASMRAAIVRGDVTFHAAPFNIEYGGAYSGLMVDEMMALPKRLADELGVPRPIVASLRDVPGAPRSLIPALVRNNISVLSIGVNNYAPRPQLCMPQLNISNSSVPCVWVEPGSKTNVTLIMTDQGVGYPLNVGPSPTEPGGLAAKTCSFFPTSPSVLCYAFRTDNSGPPQSIEEVVKYFAIAQWQWPGAKIIASTFDAWWADFSAVTPQLPVEGREMGETWVTGYASDPMKMAVYRAASREYEACVKSGACSPTDTRIRDFQRMLMKIPEHTWGVPSLYDNTSYTNPSFYALRSTPAPNNFTNAEHSWQEQRDIFTYAVNALADHPLAANIRAAVLPLTPVMPSTAGLAPGVGGQAYTVHTTAGDASLTFDAVGGYLSSLSLGAITLADGTHPLGRMVYQTVNDTDINAQHIQVQGMDCCCCYGWQNMQNNAHPNSSYTPATLMAMWTPAAGTTFTAPASFLVQLTFPPILHLNYGAPAFVWVNYTVLTSGDVTLDVQLINKTATRLGEAIYLDFSTPPVADGSAWLADVLDRFVDPRDVVVRGSQHQHGVAQGVAYLSPATGAGVNIITLDAPVMSPFSPSVPPSTLIVPFVPLGETITGFASVLFSNIYNTNFQLYSCGSEPTFPFCSYRYRFIVQSLGASASRAAAAKAAIVP